MRPSASRIAVLAALAAAAIAPAPAGAASWHAGGAVTRSGTAFGQAAAADGAGHVAVAYLRVMGRTGRIEVRRGTLRRGIRGAALVLDASTGAIGEPAAGYVRRSGRLLVGWLRHVARSHRVRATIVSARGVPGPTVPVTGGGESAYEPQVATGADGVLRLSWLRRTFGGIAPLEGDRLASPVHLPVGVNGDAVWAVDRAGTVVLAWAANGEVSVAQLPAGAPAFGPAQRLSGAGYARDPQLTVTSGGAVLAAWTEADAHGNALWSARRAVPTGAAFGASQQLAAPAEHVRGPRLAATTAGETLVGYLATDTAANFGSAAGTVRVLRLRADGPPAGPVLTLGTATDRTRVVALSTDAVGSAFAAWTTTGDRRTRVVRLAPGGIVGTARTLGTDSVSADLPPSVAPLPSGQAIAAWSQGHVVRYALYR